MRVRTKLKRKRQSIFSSFHFFFSFRRYYIIKRAIPPSYYMYIYIHIMLNIIEEVTVRFGAVFVTNQISVV